MAGAELPGYVLRAKGLADVLHQEHEVQIVGRARLELGDEVQVEVSSLVGLGVNQERTAADVVGELQQSSEHILQERRAQPQAFVMDINPKACE